MFYITFGLKLISLSVKIYFHARNDVFIMDREKVPQGKDNVPNAWRHIFVVNECVEL